MTTLAAIALAALAVAARRQHRPPRPVEVLEDRPWRVEPYSRTQRDLDRILAAGHGQECACREPLCVNARWLTAFDEHLEHEFAMPGPSTNPGHGTHRHGGEPANPSGGA